MAMSETSEGGRFDLRAKISAAGRSVKSGKKITSDTSDFNHNWLNLGNQTNEKTGN